MNDVKLDAKLVLDAIAAQRNVAMDRVALLEATVANLQQQLAKALANQKKPKGEPK